jgi:cytochrome c oxidase subunit 2
VRGPLRARPNPARLRSAAVLVAGVLWLAALGSPASAGTLLPERGGSPNADDIASLYAVILVIAGLVFAGVTAALVFALVRYNRRRNPVAAQIRGHTRLEIAWTAGATLLIVFIAAYSLTKLAAIETPAKAGASPAAVAALGQHDANALRIEVIGQQYVWMYRYPNGAYSYGEMVAPVGATVRLDIVSIDVAHSWWIPKLGGKFDAIPGYTNHTWFRATRPGIFSGQCAELCGRNHADMRAHVRAVPPDEYLRWVARQKRWIDGANAEAAREHRSAGGGQR